MPIPSSTSSSALRPPPGGYDRYASKDYTSSAINSARFSHGERAYSDRTLGDRLGGERGQTDKSYSAHANIRVPERGYSDKGYADKGSTDRGYSGHTDRSYGERSHQDKSYANRGYTEKGHPERGYSDRGYAEKGHAERGYSDRGYAEKGHAERGYSDRGYTDRGYPDRELGDKRGYVEKGRLTKDKDYGDRGNVDRHDRGYHDRAGSDRGSYAGSGGRGSALGRPSLRHGDEEDEEDERQKPPPPPQPKKKKRRKFPITFNLAGTRYDIVRQIVEQLGYTVGKDEDPNCYLIWNDSFVSTERISELKPYQRINHFPGMGEICRKDCLARNMIKMSKAHPEEFNFVPKTWIFPSEYSSFMNYARELKKKKKTKTFIVKPSNGAMGNGIQLYRNAEKVPQNDHTIVQEYLDKPFLVDGYKCDMRIYVLVTSCDPLRIFLYNDGLLRMSTEKYSNPNDNNSDQLFMHLTNYSINKHNDNYEKGVNVDSGSKRSLKYFNEYLRQRDYDVGYMWKNITEIILKTLVVAQPHVLHAYRMCRPGQPIGGDSVCFEILGFDIILDRKLRPWLLEINRSPSFGTDERIDYDVKSGVIEDSFRLLNIKASDKRKNMAAQKAEAQKRLLKPTRRAEGDVSDLEKKRISAEKKKDDLKDMLIRIRKEASREDFENRHCGRFKRIFPPDDKFRKEKYASLMSEAFGIFLSGRAGALQQEIQRTYNNILKEEDVMDMLSQCEADEQTGKPGVRMMRGPKPLQSMPVLARETFERLEDEEDESGSDRDGQSGKPRSGSAMWSRPNSGTHSTSGKSTTRSGRLITTRVRSIHNRPGSSNKLGMLNDDGSEANEYENELVQRTLVALNEMRIKFPGKTDEEAEYILDKLHENWKFHKPRIASYWLVKLDSIKRRKVIDIVRSNVRAVLQRTWKSADVDSLRLYRIVSRVFNRLLWSHGQGLWNCFQSAGNSWETIFSKSTDNISTGEMACCRRIVQLCRDCLLIVYQFAAEAKNAASNNSSTVDLVPNNPARPPSSLEKTNWSTGPMVSQRLSRLYNNRSHSLNNLNYGVS